jgi:hypothetical protein
MVSLMPLPTTRVIPAGWEAHHRAVAEGQMTAQIRFTRPTAAVSFDEVTGRSQYPTPDPLYDGPCRVQASQRLDSQQTVGDRAETVKRYQVTLPVSAGPIQINDVGVVSDATDPQLIGLTLIVVEVVRGSLVWQHDLTCTEWQPTSR